MDVFVDTHCHLDFEDLAAERKHILARAKQVGVQQIITIGIDLDTSRRAIALAEANGEIYATIGIHPHNARALSSKDIQELLTLGRKSQVVAYGEIGLDFYRNYKPRPVQISCLYEQLNVARELGLPVVIHDRDAHQEVLQILRDQKAWEIGVAMHCFSGDLAMAQEVIEMGFYISIPGPVTFTNDRRLPELVRALPLERLLIETDCPYLTPHPHRGKRNEPAYVRLVAEAIARIREIPLEEVAQITTANARALFGLGSPAVF